SDKTIVEINTKGRMLFDGIEVGAEEKTLKLEPGDRIVFYTDGIIEAQGRNGEEFGESRLCQMLLLESSHSPAVACESIYREVRNYSGNPEHLNDDFTILIIDFVA